MNTFTEPHFQTDADARKMIEGVRWPNGRVCPHCGTVEPHYATKKEGRYRCGSAGCRKDFTVTTGTVMESSHIGLHKWLMAFYLLCASKKGMSSHQLMRALDVTYKSAWFLSHRVREAMKSGGFLPPMGGAGQVVEADEMYMGKVETPRQRNKYLPPPTKRGLGGPAQKRPIVSLVERGGKVRSFHVGSADKDTITKIMRKNIDKESRLQTDESRLYMGIGREFFDHETVNHGAKEYARGAGEALVTTNSVEGYFGVFTRTMVGTYQHCAEKHLHRYLAEADFRYNHRTRLGVNDMQRTIAAVKGAEGKRLTYRQPRSNVIPFPGR